MLLKSLVLTVAIMVASPGLSFAHSALLNCDDNGNNTISCNGSYSNGSSAQGVKITVLDAKGAVLEATTLDANSECTVKKPAVAYSISFVGGDGHSVVVDGKNIVQ